MTATIESFQETCDCNEPCFYYTKITKSPSGKNLVKMIVNKCSKSSKKNVCEYLSESTLVEENLPEVREDKKINEIKSTKTEFEKIKEEILASIEELKLRRNTNTDVYIPTEKIIAFCFRIKMRPFDSKRETLDTFKKRLINFTPGVKTTVKPNIITIISTEQFPFLAPKVKTPATKQKTNKVIKTTKGPTSYLMCGKRAKLVQPGGEDDEDSCDEDTFDMDNVDSDDELNDDNQDYEDIFDEKHIEF